MKIGNFNVKCTRLDTKESYVVRKMKIEFTGQVCFVIYAQCIWDISLFSDILKYRSRNRTWFTQTVTNCFVFDRSKAVTPRVLIFLIAYGDCVAIDHFVKPWSFPIRILTVWRGFVFRMWILVIRTLYIYSIMRRHHII